MEIITDVGMFLTHLIMISTSAWEHRRFLVPIFTSPTMGNVEKQSPSGVSLPGCAWETMCERMVKHVFLFKRQGLCSAQDVIEKKKRAS